MISSFMLAGVMAMASGSQATVTGGLGFTTPDQVIHLVEIFGMGTTPPNAPVATQDVGADFGLPGGFSAGPFLTMTTIPGSGSFEAIRVIVFGAQLRRSLNSFAEVGLRTGMGTVRSNYGINNAGVFELLLGLLIPRIPGAMIQVSSQILIAHRPASGSYPGFIVNQMLRVGVAARIG